MPLLVTALAVSLCAVAASHYEKPPCQADEEAVQFGSDKLCAPKCGANGKCSADRPNGTKSQPQCVLTTAGGDKYCTLLCLEDAECPPSGQCTKPSPSVPFGVCTYAAGLRSVPAGDGPASLFDEFTAVVGRIYTSAVERERRFAIFAENLKNIAKMQAVDDDATYSHTTPFADWTVEEFLALNTLKPQLHAPDSLVHDELHNTTGLPDAFDWVEKGAVNAVKNQGMCGSCWAFSTVANIEGVNFVKTQKLVSLSEQQLVECDKTGPSGDQGCRGGLPSNAFKFLISKGMGLEMESKYPYTGRDKTCKDSKADELVFISAWKQIASDEQQMAAALVQYGPLSIGINAGPMQWYFRGIANPFNVLCNPKHIDHGVALVGFGSEPKSYWKIRNSWGSAWGEHGYYRIVRGVNKCGLTTMPTTAVIGSANLVV